MTRDGELEPQGDSCPAQHPGSGHGGETITRLPVQQITSSLQQKWKLQGIFLSLVLAPNTHMHAHSK